jgi:hypothetical protein
MGYQRESRQQCETGSQRLMGYPKNLCELLSYGDNPASKLSLKFYAILFTAFSILNSVFII